MSSLTYAHMAPGRVSDPSYPSVFVVDENTRPPPLRPPKPGRRWETLLVILVLVALCGMALEACFIYHLYWLKETAPPKEPQMGVSKQGEEDSPSKQKRIGEMVALKPMAHLVTGRRPKAGIRETGVVLWNDTPPIIHLVKHEEDEGKLIIEREGYYSVYSKLNFIENNPFHCTHSVFRRSKRYVGDDRALLRSSWSHPYKKGQMTNSTENSYLSGMFHLYKGDALYVKLTNGLLVYSSDADNYFGVYMV